MDLSAGSPRRPALAGTRSLDQAEAVTSRTLAFTELAAERAKARIDPGRVAVDLTDERLDRILEQIGAGDADYATFRRTASLAAIREIQTIRAIVRRRWPERTSPFLLSVRQSEKRTAS
ncbi:hypothetical protein GCM10009682_38320 [Luedemannella flava]|uniref:Uncharacterized protein n=1 Tax=Luedemannella flava TaxID=349316 RepID=A0ABN2M7Q5_9ACTN